MTTIIQDDREMLEEAFRNEIGGTWTIDNPKMTRWSSEGPDYFQKLEPHQQTRDCSATLPSSAVKILIKLLKDVPGVSITTHAEPDIIKEHELPEDPKAEINLEQKTEYRLPTSPGYLGNRTKITITVLDPKEVLKALEAKRGEFESVEKKIHAIRLGENAQLTFIRHHLGGTWHVEHPIGKSGDMKTTFNWKTIDNKPYITACADFLNEKGFPATLVQDGKFAKLTLSPDTIAQMEDSISGLLRKPSVGENKSNKPYPTIREHVCQEYDVAFKHGRSGPSS